MTDMEHFVSEAVEHLDIGPCMSSHYCGEVVEWDADAEVWRPVGDDIHAVTPDEMLPGDVILAAFVRRGGRDD